jgi:hypothetical protein
MSKYARDIDGDVLSLEGIYFITKPKIDDGNYFFYIKYLVGDIKITFSRPIGEKDVIDKFREFIIKHIASELVELEEIKV